MLVRKRFAATRRRRRPSRNLFGLSVRDGLQFLSSLLLPLMLGVFTVIVTFQQQKIAREQRIEDVQLARQQRLEGKNESRLQRELDWNISQIAQEAYSKTNSDRYQLEVLAAYYTAYVKEIGDMLKENNGSLTSNPLIHTLARVKTLNVLRQLDGLRQLHVIRFLYEAGQLTDRDEYVALDISTVELNNLDFQKLMSTAKIEKISFLGVYFRKCIFKGISLGNMKFSFAVLRDIDFSSNVLPTINYNLPQQLFDVDFSSAHLEYVNFSPAQLEYVNFSYAAIEYANFSFARLSYVNFSSAWLGNDDFSLAMLVNVDFSSARLDYVNFSSARFDNMNFSFTMFSNISFSSVWSYNTNFSSAQFYRVLGLTHFDHANMPNTLFEKCLFEYTDFSDANLKGSSFHSATIQTANFFHANLQNVDFTNTMITDSQLQSALTIRNAKLPNGTLGRGRNIVKNGDANCNASLNDHWRIHNGSIAVVVTDEDRSQCQFSLRSTATGASMSQRIALMDIWDSSFWTRSYLELRAQMSNRISVELRGKNSNGEVLAREILNPTTNRIFMDLSIYMQEVEVLIKFHAQQNQSSIETSWCDNIELFIDYDVWQPSGT